MGVWDTPPKRKRGEPDTRLIWRRPEWPDAPTGMVYANVPKGMVKCRETGFASSRVWRWKVGGSWNVALGVVAGPHPGAAMFAGSLQAAVDLAEALVTEQPLPPLSDEEVEGDAEPDGPTPEVTSLGDMLAASLQALGKSDCD
jgi:hypothetical protein